MMYKWTNPLPLSPVTKGTIPHYIRRMNANSANQESTSIIENASRTSFFAYNECYGRKPFRISFAVSLMQSFISGFILGFVRRAYVAFSLLDKCMLWVALAYVSHV
eukprot:6176360-Pleurochrysis_carterae.AAC.2